jgi:hypothetical protein
MAAIAAEVSIFTLLIYAILPPRLLREYKTIAAHHLYPS